MALLGVEAVEVVFGQLHLGAVQHLKPHTDEDVLDLIQGDIHGVLVADGVLSTGDGHIQHLGLQTGGQGGLGQGGLFFLQGGLQLGAHRIGQLAHHGTLLGGELAHHFQDGGELALFAQVFHP